MASSIEKDTPERRQMYEVLTKAVVSLCWTQRVPDETRGGSRKRVGGCASGFLMDVEGQWLLVTAGHVIRQMEESFKAHPPEFLTMLDDLASRHDLPHGPFDFVSAPKFFVDDDTSGVDVGFIVLTPMYKAWLSAAGCVPFTEREWLGTPEIADAYYLIGMPFTGFSAEVGPGRVIVRASVPAIRLDIELSPPESFRRPVAQVYFQIPTATAADGVPSDIGGMSGGPILALFKESGGIKVRLLAIQSRWLPQSRIAAGTRADQLGLTVKEHVLSYLAESEADERA